MGPMTKKIGQKMSGFLHDFYFLRPVVLKGGAWSFFSLYPQGQTQGLEMVLGLREGLCTDASQTAHVQALKNWIQRCFS